MVAAMVHQYFECLCKLIEWFILVIMCMPSKTQVVNEYYEKTKLHEEN